MEKVAKVEEEPGILWMRKVELSKVRDTLLLVARHGGLKSSRIAEEGIKEGIFRRRDGDPLAHSPIYHYINTGLKLGLLVKDEARCYLPNPGDPLVAQLTELNRFLEPLGKQESSAFQKLIIRNTDCRNAFFWIFLGRKDFSWEEFIKLGFPVHISPVRINSKNKAWSKKYENKITRSQLILETPGKRFAVEWGLQLWARECSLIDEVYIDETRRHILYPLDLTNTTKFDDFLKEFLKRYHPFPDGEWSFFPIDLVTYKLAPLLRAPVKEVQDRFFLEARKRMPEYIKFSSSSKGALAFRSLWGNKTDAKVLRNFFKVGDVWVTHVLVHRKLWEES
ncbi:MAG: hypothetical protein DDT31_01047 [Syntrophomonadaceae bacterium]|nr:hypothetical protein [Bacillota bacterium]MBT9138482.1 hypothetical protein [Bacillota bacterium]